MTSNVLIAIKNLINNPIIELSAHYSGRNSVNGMGNALEVYIKDLFAGTLSNNDEYSKLEKYNEAFSYTGNQNNPPVIILRNGDAIEVKKVQSSSIDLQLNSSFPKNKLYANSTMINKNCRNCEQWDSKDILYVIGHTTDKAIQELWFVYGDCFAADKEIYENTKNKIIESLHSNSNFDFAETKELGRINEVDPLGITSLRIRGMWLISQPQKVFDYIPKQEKNSKFKFYCIMKTEKFEEFSEDNKNDINNLVDNHSFFMNDISIKNPNNPAQILPAKFMEFYYE